MKDDTRAWLNYAGENLDSAKILLKSDLYNACLQNIQQSVEKLIKSLFVEMAFKLIKTHSISKLNQFLKENGVAVDISEDECDLLDTIYLPSKYPIGSVIPDYQPDAAVCRQCLEIANRVETSVVAILNQKSAK